MQERPVPPSSPGESNTPEYLLYRLGKQAREGVRSEEPEVRALRKMYSDQLPASCPTPSEHIEGLLKSLRNEDVTPELLWYALDMPQYAPTEGNDALRPEDYDDDPADS